MEARLIFSPFPCNLHSASPRQKNLRRLSGLRSAVSPNNGGGDNGNVEPKETAPPTAPNIRYRVGSRRQQERRRKREEDGGGLQKKKEEAKKWEEMGVSEKAMEVYLGEKGILFWLNKLAYAAIFLVIGGWILFRFVGPSLGLYQLDSPPLSPTSIFKNG